jgi:hypothetical protein
MMTDDRDPHLQNLFAEAEEELEAEVFTSRVLVQARQFRVRIVAGWSLGALTLAFIAWLLDIPQELPQLVAQSLTATLVDLGDSWLSWLFAPINNIASLIVLSVRALHVGMKKLSIHPLRTSS